MGNVRCNRCDTSKAANGPQGNWAARRIRDLHKIDREVAVTQHRSKAQHDGRNSWHIADPQDRQQDKDSTQGCPDQCTAARR
jgi:hypothetical protein